MPTVNSNVKLITSNQAPTTSNLAKGEMAFGQVGGVNSIYGNTGNGIIKIEFTASGEPIIYFANEEALNTFVGGDSVPASGWYAAIADDLFRFNLKEVDGYLIPEMSDKTEINIVTDRLSGWDGMDYKPWYITIIARNLGNYGEQTTSNVISGDDYNCQGQVTPIDGTDLVIIKPTCPTLVNVDTSHGGWMSVFCPDDYYEFVSGYATSYYEPVGGIIQPSETAYAIYNFSGSTGQSPYDTPITAGEKSSNADDYFELSPEGYQIIATSSELKKVKFTLEAEAPVNRFEGPMSSNPVINITFVNDSYGIQSKASSQPYTWSLTATYDDTGIDYYHWSGTTTVTFTSDTSADTWYGYCYVTLMKTDNSVDVTGTIKAELVE